MATASLCVWTWQNIKFLADNTSLFWDQNQERFGGCKRCNIFRKEVPLPMDPPCVAQCPSEFFTLGNLLRPLELILASRERVIPTEWPIRTVLGDCISRAKVRPAQAPQCRQHALISTRGSSIRHELDQGPTWRVKASEPCVCHQDTPIYRQFTGKSNCRRPPRNYQNANLCAQRNN